MDMLETNGVLDNTLLIVTADESSQALGLGEGLFPELAAHHIPLAVRTPGATAPGINGGVFAQSDIQASVLDYLGIDPGGSSGRSIFRKYASQRALLFGNVYASKFYAHLPGGRLYVCSFRNNCLAFKMKEGALFGSGLVPVSARPDEVAMIRHAARTSDLTWEDIDRKFVYYERDKKYSGRQLLLGGLGLSLRKGDRAVWYLSLDAYDPLLASIFIANMEANDRREDVGDDDLILDGAKEVKAGETLEFKYEYTATHDMDGVVSVLMIKAPPEAHYLVRELSVRKISGK